MSETSNAPDETLPGELSSAGRVNVGGVDVWKVIFEPGWTWIEETDGELCPVPHAAYIAAGRVHAKMEDG